MRIPHLPLFARVLIGVVTGALVGVVFGKGEIVLGITTGDLGELGILVVRVLKMLAVPLVLFAVLDAIIRTNVSGRMGWRLVAICMCNVSVAFVIGLTLMNTFQPGHLWEDRIEELTHAEGLVAVRDAPADALSPIANLRRMIPPSVVQPFTDDNVIGVVMLAILAGAAIRRIRRSPEGAESMTTLASGIEGAFRVLAQMLAWVVEIVPFAVFGVVAGVVGKSGAGVFASLWAFLAVILAGFVVHAFVYYPAMAWFVGRKPPRVYIGRGADAILTGVSTNSSLATVPVTLRCLDRMQVSPESSRLAALIGTNLNNDGITLYEAMAALFLAQALGHDLSLGAQLTIVAASLMAGIGVAGIPEAGLIVLPLVLSAAGMSDAHVAVLLPLVFTVDWILARGRTVVNVMADMLVAILLDRWQGASGGGGGGGASPVTSRDDTAGAA